MAKIGVKAGWSGNYVESITSAKTLLASDSGKVFMVSDSASSGYTITLPLPSIAGAGFSAKFIVSSAVLNDSASEDVIFTDGSTDSIVVKYIDAGDAGVKSVESDEASDTIGFDHTAVKGDCIELFCDGSSWYAHGVSGVDGGILVTT
jgi:hypothetical protein